MKSHVKVPMRENLSPMEKLTKFMGFQISSYSRNAKQTSSDLVTWFTSSPGPSKILYEQNKFDQKPTEYYQFFSLCLRDDSRNYYVQW